MMPSIQSQSITPMASMSATKSADSIHSNRSESSEHVQDILDSAEKWITQQLLFHEYVTAYDLLEQFDVAPNLQRMLLTRFETRTSTYDILPLSMDSTIPRSSLQPLEQMLESNINSNDHKKDSELNNLINFEEREELRHIDSNSDSSQTHLHQTQNSNYLSLDPIPSDIPSISPSVSPKMYSNPFDYIDYDKNQFESWFDREKHKYLIAVQECAASHGIGLPEFIAELIIINSVLLPGCYTLTGLLFPAARTENDLFAEYANSPAEKGYLSNKADKGIAYKRKKPMMNVRRPENNTASIWLDEDGSACGFRCIWVHGARGKLMVDQKFCVLNGCYTLTGEISVKFEQWDAEDTFEGVLFEETFCGRWQQGNGEQFGEFQLFMTQIESFYLSHNIALEQDDKYSEHNGDTLNVSRLGFHDSMGVSMEDEFDLEDDVLSSPKKIDFGSDAIHNLYNKVFDIEINESLSICATFLKQNNVLEISEKLDVGYHDHENENEVIGYGKWLRNGKMHFENVKYLEQKLLLSFNGCCDGKKVLGRLCIYHDNTQSDDDKQSKKSPKHQKQKSSKEDTENDLDFDEDENDLWTSHSVIQVEDSETEEDEEDEDEERISFCQMIIVTNIQSS